VSRPTLTSIRWPATGLCAPPLALHLTMRHREVQKGSAEAPSRADPGFPAIVSLFVVVARAFDQPAAAGIEFPDQQHPAAVAPLHPAGAGHLPMSGEQEQTIRLDGRRSCTARGQPIWTSHGHTTRAGELSRRTEPKVPCERGGESRG
jgi:hypothetical protein